jgi:hypothetical protein
MNFRHSFSHGFTFQSAYTWSHAIDDTTDGFFLTGVNDLTDLKRWRGNSNNNRTQMLQLNYVYDLPFFKKTANAFAKTALGGWQVSGISSFFSGLPLDFNCGVSGFSSGIGQSVRCNSLGPLRIKKGVTSDPTFGPVPTWFDPSVIAQPYLSQYSANGEPGMFGYLGRNVLTGPGRNNWDIALLKNFRLPGGWVRGEHPTIQFRWETYNSFNHTQFQGIQAGCGSNTPFGAPCSGNQNNLGNGEVNAAWPARQMQLGLKLLF